MSRTDNPQARLRAMPLPELFLARDALYVVKVRYVRTETEYLCFFAGRLYDRGVLSREELEIFKHVVDLGTDNLASLGRAQTLERIWPANLVKEGFKELRLDWLTAMQGEVDAAIALQEGTEALNAKS